MSQPSPDGVLKMLTKQASVPAVSNSIRLRTYYQKANSLTTQAASYLELGQDENAYVMLLRFVNLIVECIPKHNEFNGVSYKVERMAYRRKAADAIDVLEELKERIRNKYKKELVQKQQQQVQAAYDSGDAGDDQEVEGAAAAVGALPLPSAPPPPSAPLADPDFGEGTSSQGVVPQYGLPEDEQKSANTSSGDPSTHKSHRSWDNLKLPWNSAAPSATASTYTAATPSPHAKSSGGDSILHPSTKAFMNQRTVNVPSQLIQQFQKYVEKNSLRDCESCGILTGVLKDNGFLINSIIIPDQEGSSNQVHTHSEEDLFKVQDERGLLTLGWIHTHPSQTCFLSSIDLHTQFSYQVMMEEAIAIVVAPTDKNLIFSLTSKGMDVLSKCNGTGFHKHADSEGLYGVAQHVKTTLCPMKCEIIDLRKNRTW